MIGLNLPQLLWADQTSPTAGRRREKSCIFIVQYGGASHIDTLDPKPDAPAEIRGPYQPISTSVPDIQISDMLPRLAKLSQHYCLVRSLTHDKHGHGPAIDVCLSGQTNPPPLMPLLVLGSLALKPATARFPSYVWIKDLDIDVSRAYLGAGSLGQKYGPLLVAERQEDFALSPATASNHSICPQGSPTTGSPREFEVVEPPRSRVSDPETRSGPRRFSPLSRTGFWNWSVGKAAPRRPSTWSVEKAGDAATVTGGTPLGQNLLAARRLIEAGARLVTVNAWCGHPESEKFRFTEGWDHHGVAFQSGGIFSNTQDGLGFVLPRFDQSAYRALARRSASP